MGWHCRTNAGRRLLSLTHRLWESHGEATWVLRFAWKTGMPGYPNFLFPTQRLARRTQYPDTLCNYLYLSRVVTARKWIGVCMHIPSLSSVWLFATPWTVAPQTPLSMEFPRQEYWSGLPFPTLGDPPDSGIDPASLVSSVYLYHCATSRAITKTILFHFSGRGLQISKLT